MSTIINVNDRFAEALELKWDQGAEEVNDPNLWMESGLATEETMFQTSTIVPRVQTSLTVVPWNGARKEQGFASTDYRWKSEKFETTVCLDRDQMTDFAAIGRVFDVVQAMGAARAKYRNEMVFPFLEAARTTDTFTYERLGQKATFRTVAHDAIRLFGTHPNAKATPYTNIDSGGGSPFWYLSAETSEVRPILLGRFRDFAFYEFADDISSWQDNNRRWGHDGRFAIAAGDPKAVFASNQVLDETSLKAAIVSMSNFRNEDGTPANIRPTKLIVPGGLEFEALEVMKAFGVGGETNVLNNALQLVIIRYLSNTP